MAFIIKKFQWIIFAKVISYHFWSNRARTLLTSPFASKLLPLRAGHLSTLPQGHASIPGQIRWFTGPSLLSFLFALSMSCAISLFSDFIQGKPPFWVKAPIYWIKTNRVFYIAHLQKISHLLVQTPSQLDDHISRYKHIHLAEILMALSFDKKLKKSCQS